MAQAAELVQPEMVFEDDAERDPFAAYVGDETTLAAAQTLAQNRGWTGASIRKGGLTTAQRLIGVAAMPRFLIVDISEMELADAEAGLVELARLGASVLALGTVNDVHFYRRVLKTGARDYLVKPVDADALGEVFVRLEQPATGTKPTGRVIGLLGARGGVGTSTLAINIAWIMAEKFSRRTALVDMDVYGGSVALTLDIEPTRGLRDAFEDPERVDHVFLQNAMTKLTRNLHVLATEEDYDDTVRISDDKMLRLAETMRANFDMSVLDMPRHFLHREAALFSRYDDLVIVSELSLAALRDTNRIAKIATQRNHECNIHVVANRVSPKPEVSAKEFESGLERPVRANFAADTKAMTRANLAAKPLAQLEPKHRMTGDLISLCKEMAGVPEDVRRGMFRRMIGR